jgi:hypothetical protein
MTEYSRSGTVFALIADALAVTPPMTESAVCLFEAASRAPGGARPDGSYVPERLEPTIAASSAEVFSS